MATLFNSVLDIYWNPIYLRIFEMYLMIESVNECRYTKDLMLRRFLGYFSFIKSFKKVSNDIVLESETNYFKNHNFELIKLCCEQYKYQISRELRIAKNNQKELTNLQCKIRCNQIIFLCKKLIKNIDKIISISTNKIASNLV